jgi:hypothetical protein
MDMEFWSLVFRVEGLGMDMELWSLVVPAPQQALPVLVCREYPNKHCVENLQRYRN